MLIQSNQHKLHFHLFFIVNDDCYWPLAILTGLDFTLFFFISFYFSGLAVSHLRVLATSPARLKSRPKQAMLL